MLESSLKKLDIECLNAINLSIKRNNNYVDITNMKGSTFPNDVDILTYSFPCQDLSNVGAFHGYKNGIDPDSGSRSSLLWQVGRILNEIKNSNQKMPRYLFMENVPTLLSSRHIDNFKKWKNQLENLGYLSKEVKLNAKDFGIPQNRPRLLMLSVYVGNNENKKRKINKIFEKINENYIINNYKNSKFYKKTNVEELLKIPTSKESKLWKEAVECTPNDTISREKIWNNNPKIINEEGKLFSEDFVRTLTTKQDRHPNSGNLYFETGIKGKAKFRYLTPRECLLFMGFEDKDYDKLVENNPKKHSRGFLFTRDKIIRMAGNSIPVKLLEGFFYLLYELE